MKRPSRRRRESATTMLKKGRFFAPPRASRMTTMGVSLGCGVLPRKTAHYKLDRPAMPAALVRPSTSADVAAIAAIYAWHVRHGTATFEIDPPDEGEIAKRRDDVLAKVLP